MSGTGGSGWQAPGYYYGAPPVHVSAPLRRHPVAGSLALAGLLLVLWAVREYVRVLMLIGAQEVEPAYGVSLVVALLSVVVGAGGAAAAFARLRSAWLPGLLLGAAVLGTVLAVVVDAAVQIGYGGGDAAGVLLGELGYGTGYGVIWWVVLANVSLLLWAVAVPVLALDGRRAVRREPGARA